MYKILQKFVLSLKAQNCIIFFLLKGIVYTFFFWKNFICQSYRRIFC